VQGRRRAGFRHSPFSETKT